MELLKPKVERLDCTGDPLVVIERAGRTCYKSEDNITEESAPKFVQMLLNRKHHAMIEHANLVLSIGTFLYERLVLLQDPHRNHISLTQGAHGCLLSGNVRALRDICADVGVDMHIRNSIALVGGDVVPLIFTGFQDLPLHRRNGMANVYTGELTKEEQIAHQYFSYRITCDRGVTHEIVRHRPFSYAQVSTRYCNYKGGVTFIIPPWINFEPGEASCETDDAAISSLEGPEDYWLFYMQIAECGYIHLLEQGWTPQQARSVLPNSLMTEIVITGNLRHWDHFFTMRCTPAGTPEDKLTDGLLYAASAPHPQMQEVANKVLADMQKKVPWLSNHF